MGSLITLPRYRLPFAKGRVPDRCGFLPFPDTLRPANLRPLVTRISHCVIRNCVEPALLLDEAENVVVNPVFKAERQRPRLGSFEQPPVFVFEKSRAAGVEGFD